MSQCYAAHVVHRSMHPPVPRILASPRAHFVFCPGQPCCAGSASHAKHRMWCVVRVAASNKACLSSGLVPQDIVALPIAGQTCCTVFQVHVAALLGTLGWCTRQQPHTLGSWGLCLPCLWAKAFSWCFMGCLGGGVCVGKVIFKAHTYHLPNVGLCHATL